MDDWETVDFEFKNYKVGGRHFKLTYAEEHICLNDVKIAFSDIEAIRFGIYPPFRSRGWTFSLELLSQLKKKIKVEFHCGRLSKQDLEERMALWENIMRVNTERILNQMVLAALSELRAGRSYNVGNIGTTSKGVQLKVRRWLLFSKAVFVPWDKVLKREQDDWLYLNSSEEPSVVASCSMLEWNAVVLRSLLDCLWQDGRIDELIACD